MLHLTPKATLLVFLVRVAINAMKILEGQAAETLPVVMDNFTENLIINFKTAKETRHYPNWELMADAVLVNVAQSDETGRTLSLQSAIAEGLANNLGIKVAEKTSTHCATGCFIGSQ